MARHWPEDGRVIADEPGGEDVLALGDADRVPRPVRRLTVLALSGSGLAAVAVVIGLLVSGGPAHTRPLTAQHPDRGTSVVMPSMQGYRTALNARALALRTKGRVVRLDPVTGRPVRG